MWTFVDNAVSDIGDRLETEVHRMAQRTGDAERKGREWLTFEQFCDELGVSHHTAYKWSAAGQTSGRFSRFCRLPNGRIRIRREWFDAWVEGLGAAR